MLHDLSLVWTSDTPAADVASTLAMSAELGYDVVALDHVYSGPLPPIITNPLESVVKVATGVMGSAAATTSTSLTASTAPAPRPRILHRATIVVSDFAANHRLGAFAAAYDLVAPRTCMAAVRRGLHFEVCYSQALRGGTSGGGSGAGDHGSSASSSADKSGSAARARALFVANLTGLMRATRGRGIVVSSGAHIKGGGAFELRGPADVVNLLAVWGLPPDRGTEAMAALPRSIVANEGLRRRGFRGVIDVVQAAGGGEAIETAGKHKQGKEKEKEKQQQQQQQQKQQKQKHQKGTDQKKRKADDGLANGPPQARQQQSKKQRKGP
ncbi:hypothetical protein SPBR_06045 [Sporothrix brasiliensis 5110]|uniref:Uncharacterized protein n=1 Tax=Sporothrix brasiliensis 5110 TaxID=1398154 RepID=A0A0C2J5M2_9PEZI|nr:uncharacterized protein SPBR_06045 [Sporothrix brasiliensis 5110]KIH94290.1 hypothetical protein SPBR_06045 [Sporothrix brasiliensis 5110]